MLGVLLSLALSVSPFPSELGPIYSPPWMGELTALLEFLPASGQGVVAGDDTMCDNPALAPRFSGKYACVQPTGAVISAAGLPFTTVGSPTTDTRDTCSNGPDCTSRTGLRLTGTQRLYATTGWTMPQGNWLACWWGQVDRSVGTDYLVTHFWGTAADQAFALIHLSGALYLQVYDATAATSTAVANSVVTAGAVHHLCAAYTRGAGALDNVAKLYVDGVLKATSTTMRVPRNDGISPLAFGAGGNGFNATRGKQIGALFTEGSFTNADIAAMANAFLGTLTGTKNEVLTLTRGTVSSCCRDDGTGCVLLPPGRACWAGGKLKVRGPVPNLLGQSSAFEVSATWTPSLVTVSANAGIARDGTQTADALTATGPDGFIEQIAASVTGTAVYGYVDVSTASGTQPVHFALYNDTRGDYICEASITATTTLQQVGCGGTITSGNSVGLDVYPGGAGGTGTVLASGAQLTATATPRDYCPTGAAPASCAEEVPTFQTAGWWPDAQGCAAATIVPHVAGNYMKVLWVGADVLYAHINAGGPLAFNTWDGTTTVGGTLITGDPLNKPARAVVEWSGSTLSVIVNGTKTTGAFDGSWNSNGQLRFGRGDGGVPWWGDIYNVVIGNKPGACQ